MESLKPDAVEGSGGSADREKGFEAAFSTSVADRDMAVLRVIEEEALTSFTFEGLKRRIGAHPETLSRILGRLEDQRILEKANEGYRVTEKGRGLFSLHPLNATEPRLTLLRTLLPPNTDAGQILSDLRGKWFGALRWLGHSSTQEEITLKWITEDGGLQIDARFSFDSLTVEGQLLHDRDLADAIRASHQLVGYVAKVYSRSRPRNVAYFAVGNGYPLPT